MARASFRHFFSPDALKDMSPASWLALLDEHRDYVALRGLPLPSVAEGWEPDLDKLSEILNVADAGMPETLYEALYYIHEMACAEGMSALLDAFNLQQLGLTDTAGCTYADVAVRAWLADRNLLKRKHAEMRITRRRAYHYFFTDQTRLLIPPDAIDPKLDAMKASLKVEFKHGLAGDHCMIFPFWRDDGLWLMIRHGDPFKRDLQEKDGEPSIIVYRPLKYDVAVINLAQTEVRINAQPTRRVGVYRAELGQHLFDSEGYFCRTDKYTLEPLRVRGQRALLCPEVNEIDRIRLTAIDYLWGGPEGEIETRKASDVFAAYERRGRSIPKRAQISRAIFEVKFKKVTRPRTVTLDIPNKVGLTQDGDAPLIEKWLRLRGFMRLTSDIPSSDMSGFWQALVEIESLAATASEWRGHMGAVYGWIHHLLAPSESTAALITDSDGAERRVVHHGDGDYTGVNDEDGSSIPLEDEDVRIYEIEQYALAASLCSAFGFDEQFSEGTGVDRSVRLGMYRPCAGYRFSVYLTFAGSAAELHRTIEILGGRHRDGFILLSPTSRFFDSVAEQLITANTACFIPLDDAVDFMEDGSMATTSTSDTAVTAFKTSVLPAEGPHESNGMKFFETPPDARWGDVHINMIDHHTASVAVKGVTGQYNYADMGMARGKAHLPDTQWELLQVFAKNFGALTWNNRQAENKHKKRKQLLNKALVRFFRIEHGEPIAFENDEGYKARFHIGDGSYPV